MAAKSPIVSIGVPLFNGERYVEQALNSLLKQSFADFEIVVCDNASTDRTPEIVADLASSDTRIKFFSNRKNRGLVFNFNRVFELGTGKYFRWHAYDDWVQPPLLEKCVAVLEERQDVIGAYSLAHQIDGNGNVVVTDVVEEFKTALLADCPVRRMKSTITLNGWSGIIHGLFRRDAMLDYMPYRDYFGADRLLLTQLALQGKMAAVEDGLFVQRYHDDNSSRRSTREIAELLSGRPQRGLIFPMGKAFVDYLRLFRDPKLGAMDRTRSLSYLVFHGVRPDVLYNLVVPGPNNYFGLDFSRRRGKSKLADHKSAESANEEKTYAGTGNWS